MHSARVAPRTVDLLAAGVEEAAAVIDARSGIVVTYEELRRHVDTRRRALGLETRSLVVIEASNTVEFIVDYLATLADGHVYMPMPD